MARTKQDAKKTLLCATKFWSHNYDDGGVLDKTFNRQSDGGSVATLRKGVRSVARRQGHSPAALDKAERQLVKEGLLEKPRPGTLRVTGKGARVSCSTTDLSPWTDAGYPGAALNGVRRKAKRRTTKRRKSSCGCGG